MATAYYKTSGSASTTSSSGTGIKALIPKTGIFTALHMYPSGTGATWWQKVYDEKVMHPLVPFMIVFNPNSGPGGYDDGTSQTG